MYNCTVEHGGCHQLTWRISIALIDNQFAKYWTSNNPKIPTQNNKNTLNWHMLYQNTMEIMNTEHSCQESHEVLWRRYVNAKKLKSRRRTIVNFLNRDIANKKENIPKLWHTRKNYDVPCSLRMREKKDLMSVMTKYLLVRLLLNKSCTVMICFACNCNFAIMEKDEV